MAVGSDSERTAPASPSVLGAATPADVALGQQWLATMKWVQAVEVLTQDSGTTAVVRGIGNRLPVRRRIPLTIARGLVAGGVPLVQLPAPDAVASA